MTPLIDDYPLTIVFGCHMNSLFLSNYFSLLFFKDSHIILSDPYIYIIYFICFFYLY